MNTYANEGHTDKNISSEKVYSSNPILALIQKLWDVRFLRFLVIGALNTLFGYSLYALLVFIGINYTLARIMAIIIGIIFNFFTTGRVVFKNKDNGLIFRFILVYAVTMTLDVLVLRRLVAGLKINEYLAGALVTIPIALLSFLLNSIFTFKTIKLFKKKTEDAS